MTTAFHLTEQLQRLLSKSQTRKYEKGSLIQTTEQDKQSVFLVRSGYVKRYLINGGGTVYIQVIHGPGDIFPLTMILNELTNSQIYMGLETYYYETMCDSEVYTMDTKEFIDTIKNDNSLCEELLEICGMRMYSNTNKLESQALRGAYYKIAHQLVFFARRFGKEQDDGVKINLPFTHQDLADMLSLTRETVSREMVKLRHDGFITIDHYVIVHDVDELEHEAHS